MKRFIEGANQEQATLFPERLDDFIAEDNPVRVIDVFGDGLDLSGLDMKNLALSDKYWQEEVKDGNSFRQRGKRLVLRVPHYQSGEEQAAAIAAAESKGD